MQRNNSSLPSLSDLIPQLVNSGYTWSTPVIKVCAYAGCNNPRHTAKSGNIWKKCKSCSQKENKRAWYKKKAKDNNET